jgi:pyruvate,water dikinase
VYTRPVGSHGAPEPRDELWLQRRGQLERVPRVAAAQHPEFAIAMAAEAAIGATGGADVELVIEPTPTGPRSWVVQARPIVHPVARGRAAAPPVVVASLVQDGRRWTWDITHNPDPLSPAQAGLVERIERAEIGPYALRVCSGYLYMAPRGPREPVAPPVDRAELAARIAAIEARFDIEHAGSAESPAPAIDRYVAFMRIWAGELSPLVRAARRRLLDQLARQGHPPERIPALAAALVGPRRGVRDRVMAPAWDVAVPTFAERAASEIDPSDAPAASEPGEPDEPGVSIELRRDVELARAAADAAEADDLWFARAQWLVRRALLAHGAALQLRGDDVFWLPLDEVVTLRSVDPDDAHRRASAARAAHQRAAEWDMPIVVDRNEPSHTAARELTSANVMLRGIGLGPRVVGRVVRIASLTHPPRVRRGDVVVARAIPPALAMVVEGCAALVSETGGLLDHGAALARELGIPCVVGCAGAWAQLTDGAIVAVDGDAGVVELAE